MNTESIIQQICTKYGTKPGSIIKKKYGKLPAYTYRDVLLRILTYTDSRASIADVFPEMSRPTISSMLIKGFPGNKPSAQTWYVHLLLSVGLKRCSVCKSILDISHYSRDLETATGLRSECKVCDNAKNKVHREEYREHYKHTKHLHYIANKSDYYRRSILRKGGRAKATPSWVNHAELQKIYDNRPEGYHVDHIIPLAGELVCGLHVEHNLQYLPASVNISKGNKFDIDSYIHTTKYLPPYL